MPVAILLVVSIAFIFYKLHQKNKTNTQLERKKA
jgi:hypothetical protein